MPTDSKPAETETAKAPVDEATTLMSPFTPEAFAEDTETTTETAPDQAADEESPPEEEQPEEEEVDPSEESDEEEQPDEQPPPAPRKIRVEFNGTPEEVDEPELIKGYIRTKDYTHSKMALAEERKAFEVEAQAVRERDQRYATALKELEDALKPSEPDWEKIQKEAPEQFPALHAQYQIQLRNYQIAQDERAKAEAVIQQDRAKAHAKFLLEQREKLYETVPELKEPENAKKLASYLKETYRFTDEEIAGTTRHELLVMARKAQLYDEAMKKKPEIKQKVESKIRPAKPGASASVRPVKSQLERDAKRLEKTGSIQDAAKVFERFV